MENLAYGWGLPPDISTYGPAIDRLIIVLQWFMILLFVGWGIFMLYCLVRFRQRAGHKASYESSHSRIPKLLEVGVVLFEVFLLVGLSFPVWSRFKNDFPPPEKSLMVRIVAQQFVWNIHYPGPDGKFGGTDPKRITAANVLGLDANDPAALDDIVTVNDFHFPVHRPVIVNLTSKDVIHSFYLPVMRVKQDTIPGMTVPVWFEATQTAKFEIACAQLCGNGHTTMRGFATVETPDEFNAWLAQQTPVLAPPAAGT